MEQGTMGTVDIYKIERYTQWLKDMAKSDKIEVDHQNSGLQYCWKIKDPGVACIGTIDLGPEEIIQLDGAAESDQKLFLKHRLQRCISLCASLQLR